MWEIDKFSVTTGKKQVGRRKKTCLHKPHLNPVQTQVGKEGGRRGGRWYGVKIIKLIEGILDLLNASLEPLGEERREPSEKWVW